MAERLVGLINLKLEEKETDLQIVEFYIKIQLVLIDYYIRNFSSNIDHQLFFNSIEKIRNFLQSKINSYDSYLDYFLEFNSNILKTLYDNLSNCESLISSNFISLTCMYHILLILLFKRFILEVFHLKCNDGY